MAGNKYDVTTVFKADISQFSDSVKSLQRYISTVNSEFNKASGGSKDWANSQDGLKAKITQLTKTLYAHEKILEELQNEYNAMSEEERTSTEYGQKLALQINKTSTAISKAKNDIDKYNKALVENNSEAGKNITAAQKLRNTIEKQEKSLADLKEDYLNVTLVQGKNSKEAKNLKSQIDKLNKELNENKGKLGEVGEAAKESGDGFTVAKGAIAGFIAGGLIALVGATSKAISTVLGLADATREYRQTLATLDTAANDAGVSTDYVRDKFTDLMGVFNDEGSVTEGLNNLLTAGFDEKSLDDVTAGLEGAALKWKDTLKFEGLADSLQEWIGSGGKNLTGNFAELLERMGYNLEEVQEKTAKMTDEQRRTYVTNLLAAEGLNTVSESYREQNKDMVDAQKANVDYQNTVANLGAKVEPITTKIRKGFTRLLEKVIELVDGVDLEAFGEKIDTAFDKVINEILPKLIDGLSWIIKNKDTIIAGIVGIGAAFVAWKVVGIIQAVVKAMKGMTLAQAALNLVMSLNPIGLIVTAIAGLVAAFIYLWNNCEAFRKFWINLWENIKKVADIVWKAIKGFFKSAWEFIKSIWSGAGKFFSNIWKGIQKAFSAVGSWFSNLFQKAWNGVKNAWSGTKKFFSNIWSGIKNVFSSVGSWFGNIFKKAWTAIKNAFSSVGSFFGGIWETIKSKFTSIGTKVGNAIGGAFKKAINAVLATVEKAINAIPNAVNGAIGKINELTGMNIGKMGTVSLPRLAQGGIVDKATIVQIGEAGKEAVIPLEKNTKGLKEIAHLVAEEIGVKGGGVTVNNYNTFSGMRTTRYALHRATNESIASWKLVIASQGGR